MRSFATRDAGSRDLNWWRSAIAENRLLEAGAKAVAEGKRARELLAILEKKHDHTIQPPAISSFSSLRLVFYHYGKINLARLFTDPLWAVIDSSLPNQAELLSLTSLASDMLHPIADRIPYAGLESSLLLPVLLTAALELSDKQNLDLLTRSVQAIAAKGFITANTYLSDMELAWKMKRNLKHSRVSCDLLQDA